MHIKILMKMGFFFLVLMVFISNVGATTQEPALLINLQQRQLNAPDGHVCYNTPSYFASNASYIDTLPFDGVAILSTSGRTLMDGALHDRATMAAEWLPMKGLVLNRVKNNFAVVNVDRPADFFDNWSNTVASFQNLAIVLKEMGIKGVVFDNEEYVCHLWDYQTDVSYKSTKTLQQYYDQVRLRGRQIMQAMQTVYPDITVFVLLSPADNFQNTPDIVNKWNRNPNILAGAFTVGMMVVANVPIVDGNEVSYNYRTQAEFDASKLWRKTSMGTDAQNCPFIPSTLRNTNWSNKISVAEAVYNYPMTYANGEYRDMNPTIMGPVLEMAIRGSEKYAWLYWEGGDWYRPSGIDSHWFNAVQTAWANTRSSTLLNNGPYTLTANISGNGLVTKNPDNATYTSGTQVTLTANPSSGYQFANWGGDFSGNTNPLSTSMSTNKVALANFTLIPINGVCGITNNLCIAGTLNDKTDSSTNYRWRCTGAGGGTTAACSLIKLVNGACGSTNNECTAGTLNDTTDSSTNYQWSCTGAGGGTAVCSLPLPVNGVCGTTNSTCIAGTVIEKSDSKRYYRWNCASTNGGTTATCSLPER